MSESYKIAVIGSRGFRDYNVLSNIMEMARLKWPNMHIVSGGANGADKLAAAYAKCYDIPLTEYLPDWNKHGRSAGFIRNCDIVGDCVRVIAFWDGDSKGTLSSLRIAKKLGKPVNLFALDGSKMALPEFL